jgi:hypothetical protein
MWPALSITKPEPSACCPCDWKGVPNGSVCTLGALLAVICTTPGALRR